jgi:hypothetical protein
MLCTDQIFTIAGSASCGLTAISHLHIDDRDRVSAPAAACGRRLGVLTPRLLTALMSRTVARW